MRLYEMQLPFDVDDHSSLQSYLTRYFGKEDYFNKEKNIKIDKINMDVDTYIRLAEDMLTKSWGQQTVSRRETGIDKIKQYAQSMSNGNKFPIPVLNFLDNTQDGLHRVEAAKELGINKVPVIVVDNFKKE